MFYVYILKCRDGGCYIGCTAELKQRLERHNKGEVLATRDKLPVRLETQIVFPISTKRFGLKNTLSPVPAGPF